MSDITHQDLADDGFHEIQLSGKQLVFLFMATTIVAVVIFLCGVQVGRNVRSVHAVESGDPLAATTTSATAPAPVTSTASAPPATEPPPPAQDTEDDLSYAKRLQSDAAPKEQLKPRTDTPSPAAAPVASAPAASAPAKSAPVSAPVTKPAATPPPAPAASRPTASASTARPGIWVVQVQALTDRGAASAMAQRLGAKGYPAFVLEPKAGAPVIYRVQVGRYNDRREAEQIARRLEKEEQFKPWVQR